MELQNNRVNPATYLPPKNKPATTLDLLVDFKRGREQIFVGIGSLYPVGSLKPGC